MRALRKRRLATRRRAAASSRHTISWSGPTEATRAARSSDVSGRVLERPPIDRARLDRRGERVGLDRRVVDQAYVDQRRVDRRVVATSAIEPDAMHRRGDAHRLEQRTEGDLARAAVEVVDAVVTRVERMDHHMSIVDDPEAEALPVVAARRPARAIEHVVQRPLEVRAHRPGDGILSWRRASANVRRCIQLLLPPGRHVRVSR